MLKHSSFYSSNGACSRLPILRLENSANKVRTWLTGTVLPSLSQQRQRILVKAHRLLLLFKKTDGIMPCKQSPLGDKEFMYTDHLYNWSNGLFKDTLWWGTKKTVGYTVICAEADNDGGGPIHYIFINIWHSKCQMLKKKTYFRF